MAREDTVGSGQRWKDIISFTHHSARESKVHSGVKFIHLDPSHFGSENIHSDKTWSGNIHYGIQLEWKYSLRGTTGGGENIHFRQTSSE